MKKLYGEKTRLAGVDGSADEVVMRFRAGGTYKVARAGYAEAAERALKAAPGAAEAVAAARNRYEKARARKGAVPPEVEVSVREGQAEGPKAAGKAAAVAEKAWDDFMLKWGDVLEHGRDDVFKPEGSSESFEQDLTAWAYSQDGRPLVFGERGRDVVLVEGARPAYYYTDHESRNGREIWYKAVDPFAFFGSRP